MHLVEVYRREGMKDAHASGVRADLVEAGLTGVTRVDYVLSYLLSEALPPDGARAVAERLLTDPVTREFRIDAAFERPDGAHSLLVLRKPGVMDPVALSLENAIRDMDLPVPGVRTGRRYVIHGPESAGEMLAAAGKVIATNGRVELAQR